MERADRRLVPDGHERRHVERRSHLRPAALHEPPPAKGPRGSAPGPNRAGPRGVEVARFLRSSARVHGTVSKRGGCRGTARKSSSVWSHDDAGHVRLTPWRSPSAGSPPLGDWRPSVQRVSSLPSAGPWVALATSIPTKWSRGASSAGNDQRGPTLRDTGFRPRQLFGLPAINHGWHPG
jgi:hypothetical protein